jgi:hypothetical protein
VLLVLSLLLKHKSSLWIAVAHYAGPGPTAQRAFRSQRSSSHPSDNRLLETLLNIRDRTSTLTAGPFELLTLFIIIISLLMSPLPGYGLSLYITHKENHNPPRGPSTDWWVLTTANTADQWLYVPFKARSTALKAELAY